MNAANWLTTATQKLSKAEIGTARLDALILLEDATDHERGWLLAHPQFELSSEQTDQLQKLLTRRETHEPLAYIRGKTEFYGRDFRLSPAVLEPRPESETMIDLLKALPIVTPVSGAEDHHQSSTDARTPNNENMVRIADVGTGSGALGITASLELENASVDLLEIDPEAAQIAKTNVVLLTTGIPVIISDLLANSSMNYDILLCNLPYVPDSHTINQAATHEPAIAIFGGPDGLDLFRKLFEQIRNMQKRPLYLLFESLPPQHTPLVEIANKYDYELQKTDDFIQQFVDKQ